MKTQLKPIIRWIDVADTYLTPKPKGTKVWHPIIFYVLENVDLTYSEREKAVLKCAVLVGNELISRQKHLFVKVVRDVAFLKRHCIW